MLPRDKLSKDIDPEEPFHGSRFGSFKRRFSWGRHSGTEIKESVHRSSVSKIGLVFDLLDRNRS